MCVDVLPRGRIRPGSARSLAETSATALLVRPRPRWACGVYPGLGRATLRRWVGAGEVYRLPSLVDPESLPSGLEPARHLRAVGHFVPTGPSAAIR
ncbi:Protein of unknown function [Micromonospora lupini str. Lupac 08]|uniref:Uncharacterized protein n=1 Tax=Micromonospora lupini str. Lupac 08 TaxID=1150864 RepID=I0L7Q0_9ACTN|nr:Protein of unknown function [Micromonospora lupini str. Lupac 08]